MSNNEYARCQYLDHEGLQCDVWFKTTETEFKLCPHHSGIISDSLAAEPEHKDAYIRTANEERALCYKMTIEENEAHYAEMERQVELMRIKMIQCRAVRAEKIDNLNEEERKVLRATKVSRGVKNLDPNKPTSAVKKDPVLFLMEKYGYTRLQAEKMMND